MEPYDFSGYATRNNLLCSDGRTIRKDAFKDDDGKQVPLMWNHQHDDVSQVLGHAMLQNVDDGVRAYCTFNNTQNGQDAKLLVQHGDIVALSIFANHLKQQMGDVLHGAIREVSLVLANANPGAFIDDVVMAHGDDGEGEAIIYTGLPLELYHADKDDEKQSDESKKGEDKEVVKEDKKKPEESEKTIEDVFNSMTEEQQTAVYAIVAQIAGAKDDNEGEENKDSKDKDSEDDKDKPEGGDKTMKHNVFDQEQQNSATVLSHAAQGEILALAKSSSVGSLKTAMQIYAEQNALQHGDISGFVQSGAGNVATLFPEYVEAHPSNTPELIKNDLGWVDAIMAKTQKVPHGRVRTSSVDIRNIDSLKAKGYKKGDKKQITGNYQLVRRTTDAQTVYVTSELHRDDVVDIEDFDYVQFQYGIDQYNLKETLGVATLLGDEREDSDPQKIFPEHIRPVWTDDELYTIHKDIDYDAMAKELQGTDASANFGKSFVYAEAMITALRMARKDFRGTGKPDLFISTDMHSIMTLARDRNGRRIYDTDAELASALGVANIYEVTQFEGKVREDENGDKHKLLAIYVNMADYAYGASKGGDITHFTDFDIKFNQLQSLLETRKSGQLTRIKSAIVLEEKVTV